MLAVFCTLNNYTTNLICLFFVQILADSEIICSFEESECGLMPDLDFSELWRLVDGGGITADNTVNRGAFKHYVTLRVILVPKN
jgi:hypothetical protein